MTDLRIAKRELEKIRKEKDAKQAVIKRAELEPLFKILSEELSKNKSACDALQGITKDDVRFIAHQVADRLSDVLSDNEAELEVRRNRRAETSRRRSKKEQNTMEMLHNSSGIQPSRAIFER